MNKTLKRGFSRKQTSAWRRASIALMSAMLIISGHSHLVNATPAPPVQLSQRQEAWDAALRTARLVNNRNEITAMVLQLDILDKPETTYANAIYQIFAWQNGRWNQVYVNTGARLINNARGRVTLAPEVVLLSELQRQLGDDNLSDVELKAVVQLRYDLRGGQRNQLVEWEQTQYYNAIAQTSTTQIATLNTTTVTQTSSGQTISVQPAYEPLPVAVGVPNNQLNPHRGHFSLAIRQSQVTLQDVIARVSLKSRRPNAFLQERFIGDFRYRMNQRAQFIRGLNPGDRVVVRLFTPQNVFIGYSEFELLDDNSAVTLVLPNQTSEYGVVRTVYGIDADQNGSIDANTSTYDYFTQIVRNSQLNQTRVTFLNSTQSINARLFEVQGLPTPPRNCTYSSSFTSGAFALVSRTLYAFSGNLASAITALPGQVVQIISINSNRTEIYEVSQLIVNYREVGVSQGAIVRIDDDGEYEYDNDFEYDDDDDLGYDDDDDNEVARPARRHCNQGIGNGAEGCDPGNSRPHGGSNDETGRTPGNRPRRR